MWTLVEAAFSEAPRMEEYVLDFENKVGGVTECETGVTSTRNKLGEFDNRDKQKAIFEARLQYLKQNSNNKTPSKVLYTTGRHIYSNP